MKHMRKRGVKDDSESFGVSNRREDIEEKRRKGFRGGNREFCYGYVKFGYSGGQV